MEAEALSAVTSKLADMVLISGAKMPTEEKCLVILAELYHCQVVAALLNRKNRQISKFLHVVDQESSGEDSFFRPFHRGGPSSRKHMFHKSFFIALCDE